MKLVVFGPDRRTGVLRDDAVIDLSYAYAKFLHECENVRHPLQVAAALVPSDLTGFIEAGAAALERVHCSLDYLTHGALNRDDPRGEDVAHDLGTTRLHAPHPRGARIACAGSNFSTHRQRMAQRGGREEHKPFIWGFWKIDKDSVGPDGEVIYPARCERLDYEGEVAVIIAKQGKDLRPEQWRDYIFGVTLCCDWSIRGPREQLGPMNFAPAKNFDTSLSLGPCVVIGEADPSMVDFETLVNGQTRQRNNTREMIFSFAEYLQYLSRDLTLYPGDIICSGTGEGTIADASVATGESQASFLKPGDLVEVRSGSIGTLRSRIVAKPT